MAAHVLPKLVMPQHRAAAQVRPLSAPGIRLAALSSFDLGFIQRLRLSRRYKGSGSMPTRREIILGAACAAIAGAALAAEPSPRDFVTAIYDAYKGKDAKGHPL